MSLKELPPGLALQLAAPNRAVFALLSFENFPHLPHLLRRELPIGRRKMVIKFNMYQAALVAEQELILKFNKRL